MFLKDKNQSIYLNTFEIFSGRFPEYLKYSCLLLNSPFKTLMLKILVFSACLLQLRFLMKILNIFILSVCVGVARCSNAADFFKSSLKILQIQSFLSFWLATKHKTTNLDFDLTT